MPKGLEVNGLLSEKDWTFGANFERRLIAVLVHYL